MTEVPAHGDQSLAAEVRNNGFAFVGHVTMRALLERSGGLDDWASFAASWNDLGPDTYLARTGRDRSRRHAVFSAEVGGPAQREAHQPHYQSLHYNPLQGDIERWFDPVQPEIGESRTLAAILQFSRAFFEGLAGPRRWRIEVHQFRIKARADQPGQPTPEGMHRDGVDYVLVLLIARENIARGTTTIHSADGRELGSFTLIHPLDAALVDDASVFHGVTPVSPMIPKDPAYRDVLVVTFRTNER